MRKKFLIFSIVCLLFWTLSYTYSSFKNTIVGNISGNIKDWVFKVSIDNSTKYEDGYKLHLTGTSGSFNVNINTVGGTKNADYSIELIGDSSIKYYTDSNYTSLISNNIYNGSINSNTSGTVTIYYKSSSNINSDIIIKTKATIKEVIYAMMKNGYSSHTAFWGYTYRGYIRTVTFSNDLSKLPRTCTEKNLCWDVSYDASQENKVYAYFIDSGLRVSESCSEPGCDPYTTIEKALYNLYIVSEATIAAPSDCSNMFFLSYAETTNLIQINFNNNFNTSNATNMYGMFWGCLKLGSLDLSGFDTSKVTNMSHMFNTCDRLVSLNLSSFNTSNVRDMSYMFYGCHSVQTEINIMNAGTSSYKSMFGGNTLSMATSYVILGYTTNTKSIAEAMKSKATYPARITLKAI